MNRIETIPHLRSAFRQQDNDGKKSIVAKLREEAIALLEPLKDTIPRSISEQARTAYQERGLDLAWQLRIYDDAMEFASAVKRIPNALNARPTHRKASHLLELCTRVLAADTVTDAHVDWVLDAYADLDSVAVDTGRKFTTGRRTNTGGPIRKKIAALLKKTPEMKNPQLWDEVVKKLPRGWQLIKGSEGLWLDGPSADQHMTQRRFFNLCGEERKKRR